jgi:Small integral membrane protein
MENLLIRLKNPVFLLALAGLIYQFLPTVGITIDMGTYQTLVDVISYAFIGIGVYSNLGDESSPRE